MSEVSSPDALQLAQQRQNIEFTAQEADLIAAAYLDLVEQYQALREAAEYDEDQLRMFGKGADVLKARHRLEAALSNPASSSLNPQVHRDGEQGPNGEQEGVTECRACGASIAWGGEFPADCIRCGASFQEGSPDAR